MANTIKPTLFENKQIKPINNSNQEWSLQKINKSIKEQMELTLIIDNGSNGGAISSKNPTKIN